jgi:hypothetical protein
MLSIGTCENCRLTTVYFRLISVHQSYLVSILQSEWTIYWNHSNWICNGSSMQGFLWNGGKCRNFNGFESYNNFFLQWHLGCMISSDNKSLAARWTCGNDPWVPLQNWLNFSKLQKGPQVTVRRKKPLTAQPKGGSVLFRQVFQMGPHLQISVCRCAILK